mgnify:CR=1 FL=1
MTEGSEQRKWAEGKDREEEAEEARKVKYMKCPHEPSQLEVEDHMINHMPYRSWCEHCIKGRAVAPAHNKVTEVEKQKRKRRGGGFNQRKLNPIYQNNL